MKSLLKFAALYVVVLLAFPPAFGEGLCLFAQNGQMPGMDCCNTADHDSAPGAAVSFSMAPECTGGGSLAPLSPTPTAPDKLKTSSSTFEIQHSVAVTRQHASNKLAFQVARSIDATANLQVLLRTFRI